MNTETRFLVLGESMKETGNGIEIYNVEAEVAGNMFFDNDNFYIALGAKPIVIKHISDDMLQQIGDFFYFRGRNPESTAKRIDFNGLSIRIDETIIYFIGNDVNLQFQNIAPSEMKKFGMWLRKKVK